MNRLRLLLLLSLLMPLTGCVAIGNLLRKKSKPTQISSEAAKALPVGVIELVNPDANFVIVHTNANSALPAGTELTSTSATGETAKLKVAPERKNIFITADIISGAPQKGDRVLQGRVPSTSTATATASSMTGTSSSGVPTVSISPGAIAAPLPTPPPVVPAEFLRPVPANP